MEIKIWSEVRCPFCYIGKHKLEKALEKFEHKNEVKISWHSFELDPYLETNQYSDTQTYLTESKGYPKQQVTQMMKQVLEMGKDEGLDFNYETSVVANTYNAHRLIQFTKTKNLDNKIEEALFKAQFSDGKNIDDLSVLAEIGTSIGLDKMEVEEVLSQKDKFASEVAKDLETAKQLGIRSVPFFVFNDKYGVSGAQPSEAFTEMLEKVWKEFSIHTSFENLSEGKSCSIDGDCD